ncbi:hypothetical protein EDD29_6436 [Actinocorallia herbida]|uniref:Uncharacterized protein n=1 Tax=Actinocorallia herbida TaxID=58109 RepID=A0A3N1D5E5_9ACTN|nr:hypothetical protein [Actinocorallia herbida]ROO88757.1 hypothetical protein EDD29_6436 [Actinocorallia herbida]
MTGETFPCRTCGNPAVQPATGRPRRYCSPACKRRTEQNIRAARRRLRRAERAVSAWHAAVTGQDPLAGLIGTPEDDVRQWQDACARRDQAHADLAALLRGNVAHASPV